MNKALKNVSADVFVLYIKGSLHVSLAVTAFSYITVKLYQLYVPEALYIIIFSSTVLAYNFTKYLVLFKHKQVSIRGTLKSIAAITILAFTGLVYGLSQLDFKVLVFLLIPGLLTAAYAMPVFQDGRNLRQTFGIKLLIIAAVWALVTTGLPFVANDGGNHSYVLMFSDGIQRLMFVMVLTLPFDIRDVQEDSQRLGTIPQIFGIKKTKLIGMGILISVVIIEIFQTPESAVSFLVFLLVTGISGILIWRSMKVQSEYFASFWVEGIPIGWAILLWLFI